LCRSNIWKDSEFSWNDQSEFTLVSNVTAPADGCGRRALLHERIGGGAVVGRIGHRSAPLPVTAGRTDRLSLTGCQPFRQFRQIEKDQLADLDPGRPDAEANPSRNGSLRHSEERGDILGVAVLDAVDDQLAGRRSYVIDLIGRTVLQIAHWCRRSLWNGGNSPPVDDGSELVTRDRAEQPKNSPSVFYTGIEITRSKLYLLFQKWRAAGFPDIVCSKLIVPNRDNTSVLEGRRVY
jgi:hypothetical protein